MLPRSVPWGEVVTKAVKDRGWAIAWLLTYGNELGSPVTPAWGGVWYLEGGPQGAAGQRAEGLLL